MKRPASLKKGDKIGIVSSARKINASEVSEAIKCFTNWGLKVMVGDHLYAEHHQFAGSDEERAADLQEMLDDPEIKAIVFARGGYGSVRIVDRMRWNKFVKQPKWLVGYSDITVFHSHIHQNFGVETLHAVMPLNFASATKEALSSLKSALFGESLNYQIAAHPFNRKGNASGKLIGGNLSILYNLSGTPSAIDSKNKILFIEDLDEYLYHIDRMMQNLKRNGILDKLAGLIIGGMTDMNDNPVHFGMNAYEIIQDTVKEFDYPVCFNFPTGHFPDNRCLILGRKVKLDIGSEVSLSFTK